MPPLVLTTLLDRRDPGTGDWVVVRIGQDRVAVESGGTGNRLDPARRVRRSAWEIRRIQGDIELLATWPVPELVTHRIGEHVDQLRDDLARAGTDADADLTSVVDALPDALVPAPGPDLPLDAALWAAAYPLLRTPVAQGARPDHVPIALDGTLRAADPRQACRRAFGRGTRPLVRAVAESLLPGPDGRIPFEPMLLALMASPWCGPERLTEIVSTPPQRPGAVAFDIGDVDRGRAMFHGESARRIGARLVAALAQPDGLVELARDLAGWVPPAPEPAPDQPARPQGPAPRPPAPAAQVPPAARTDVPLVHPSRLQAVDGLEVGAHRIVLPRTADELMEWGMVLDNCLGGFRHAVAGGRTHLLGVAEGGTLRYAVEVTRSGVVRQFEGVRNRQAPLSVTVPVLTALRDHGVVSADGRRGRSLAAPA